MRSPFKQMGYLMVDHRASPGLSEDIARKVGYDPKMAGEGKVYEADTLRCSHCSGHVVKNPFRVRERHSCMKCGGNFICDGCAYLAAQPDYVHTPITKVIEDIKQAVMGSPSGLLFPTN